MPALPWIALGVFAALLMSVSHILAIIALRRLSLPAFLALRAVAGLVFCLPWLPRLLDLTLAPRDWLLFAASLVLSPFLLGALFFSGLSSGRFAAQGGLRQLSPGMVALWQWAVLGAVHPAHGWLGVAFSAGGAFMLVAHHPPGQRAAMGLGFAAAATQAAALLVQTALVPRLDPLALIAAQNLGFTVLTTAWLLSARVRPDASAATASATGPSLRLAVFLALLSGVVVQVLFDQMKFALLPRLGAVPTSCLLLLQLPFFTLLARVCFREKVGRPQSIALALIFAGALLGAR